MSYRASAFHLAGCFCTSGTVGKQLRSGDGSFCYYIRQVLSQCLHAVRVTTYGFLSKLIRLAEYGKKLIDSDRRGVGLETVCGGDDEALCRPLSTTVWRRKLAFDALDMRPRHHTSLA